MDHFSIFQRLESEVAAGEFVVSGEAALGRSEQWPNLSGVVTDSYDENFSLLTSEMPEVTVVFDLAGRPVEVFATLQSGDGTRSIMRDSKGIEVPLRGGIDTEQFLYFCSLRFEGVEINRITVYRRDAELFQGIMHTPDVLFLLAALKAYNLTDQTGTADKIVVNVAAALDNRDIPRGVPVPGSDCGDAAWCPHGWGSRCIKGLRRCSGIIQ